MPAWWNIILTTQRNYHWVIYSFWLTCLFGKTRKEREKIREIYEDELDIIIHLSNLGHSNSISREQ